MTVRRLFATAAVALALVAAACGNNDTESGKKATTTTAKVPTFAAGTTMARLQAAGKMIVGTKFDQRGFGLRNPTSGQIEGFDVEIAKLIATKIFGSSGPSKVQFVEAVSKNREPYIQNGTVDIVVATYTINDARKQVVDFAGPYFVTHQDIMVKRDDSSITKVEDLNGKKVCTAQGSTSEKNLRAKAPSASITLFDTYDKCGAALTDGRVQAVSTDAPILAGLVSDSNGTFKLVEHPFSDEPYGVGLKKGDDAFRTFLNDTLEQLFRDGSWAKAFSATLGKLGLPVPTPPTIDRYTSTAATATTAASTGATSATTTAATTKPTVTTTPATTAATTATTMY